VWIAHEAREYGRAQTDGCAPLPVDGPRWTEWANKTARRPEGGGGGGAADSDELVHGVLGAAGVMDFQSMEVVLMRLLSFSDQVLRLAALQAREILRWARPRRRTATAFLPADRPWMEKPATAEAVTTAVAGSRGRRGILAREERQ
jgi:hypothetical protein